MDERKWNMHIYIEQHWYGRIQYLYKCTVYDNQVGHVSYHIIL